MRRVLILLYLALIPFSALAQQGPVYGQYFHNPFLYNPGFGGIENHPSLTLTHQRQLMGIEGAPVASTLVFNSPILKNIALGAKIFTESQGLFRSSSGQLALTYVLPLNHKTNLRFGLSGGVSKSQLDLSTASDAQASYLAHLSTPFNQLEVGFGMVIHNEKLKIGVSFPNMTKRSLITNSLYDQVKLMPLGHVVFTTAIKFDLVPGQMELEPVFIFERIHSLSQQKIEVGSLLYLKEMLWVGATYKHQAGLSGLLGVKIKESIRFGYAYGMTSAVTSVFSNASHELQLKIKLGKEFRKKERVHTPRFQAFNF